MKMVEYEEKGGENTKVIEAGDKKNRPEELTNF